MLVYVHQHADERLHDASCLTAQEHSISNANPFLDKKTWLVPINYASPQDITPAKALEKADNRKLAPPVTNA